MKAHQRLFWLLVFLLPVQLGRHFWPEWAYVLGLRVDYLAPTIYLTDILVVGILIAWWLKNSSEVFSRLRLGITSEVRQYWWIIVVFLYLLVTSLLAQNSGAALYKFAKIIEFTLFGFYVAKNRYPLSAIRYPLSLALIYSSLIAIAQFLRQSSIGGPLWWLGERTFNSFTPGIAKAVINGRLIMRPYATFPHPNVLAGFILVSLILITTNNKQTLGLSLGRRQTTKGVLKWAAVVLGIIAIIISFSRSAWLVGLIISLLIFLRHLRGVLRIKDRFYLGGGEKPLIFLCCLLIIAAFGAVLLLKLPFSTEEAISQRLQLIKVAFSMVRERPLIGVGLNNFISQLPNFWQNIGFTYWLQPVHNIFLLVAAEVGLVGLAAFLWFLLLTYKKLLITNNQLLITAFSAILALGLFDHYWLTLQQSQLLFTIVLGLSWRAREG